MIQPAPRHSRLRHISRIMVYRGRMEGSKSRAAGMLDLLLGEATLVVGDGDAMRLSGGLVRIYRLHPYRK
jgi:hypothetical protein